MGILEIEDITPVGRDGFGSGTLLERAADQGVLAGPRWPQREEVVTLMVDADAETNGLDGALLGDKSVADLQISRGLDLELLWVAAPIECRRFQWCDGCPLDVVAAAVEGLLDRRAE
jgi:hypothetical protein